MILKTVIFILQVQFPKDFHGFKQTAVDLTKFFITTNKLFNLQEILFSTNKD